MFPLPPKDDFLHLFHAIRHGPVAATFNFPKGLSKKEFDNIITLKDVMEMEQLPRDFDCFSIVAFKDGCIKLKGFDGPN